MKKRVTAVLLRAAAVGAAMAWGAAAPLAEDVSSLRGRAVTDSSNTAQVKQTMAVPGGFDVAWEQQPPMIPHPIDKYSIDLRQNGCLKCHSPATFEANKAPKVADSHFFDRDGKKLDTLSPRRYFCTQCHASQAGAMPLVENVFGDR